MDSLITDALSYSKLVRQHFELKAVDAGALLRGILESYPEFQPPHAQVDIAGSIPLVMGNKAGLTQCFSNLLGNAVKFVRPGTVAKVRVWAEVRKVESGTGGGRREKWSGFGSRTTELGFRRSIRRWFSQCSSSWIQATRARESDWHWYGKSWNGCGARRGSNRSPEKGAGLVRAEGRGARG